MFAHQVIEALRVNQKNISSNAIGLDKALYSYYQAEHENALGRIMKAQHFYLGEQHAVLTHGPGKSIIGRDQLFMGMSEYMRLPYRICTFSSHKAHDEIDDELEQPSDIRATTLPSNRRFAVIEQLDPETLRINLASHMEGVAKINHGNGWMLQQEVYFVRIGRAADADWVRRFLPIPYRPRLNYGKGNVFPMPLIPGKVSDIAEDVGDLSMIHVALLMLNCKNIVTEKIVAPIALNKKRRKQGKQEIFSYHVLNVLLPKKKQGYHTWGEPVGHNRVHLCRGHFKEYTVEHPLFGHYVGMYWWQPHVRGQNRQGVVMKDYKVTTGTGNGSD
jgi:hypothetical protein